MATPTACSRARASGPGSSRLPADLVVYATGYGSMNQLAAGIIGQEMADKAGRVWGLGSGTTKDPGPWEGELLKARMAGIPTPVYNRGRHRERDERNGRLNTSHRRSLS